MGELFADFMEEAPHMLLFLKSVRVLELYVIEADGAEPQLQFCTSIANATPALLAQRQMAQLSTAASSPTPSAVSNTLDLSISVQRHPQDAASARVEQWLVCQSMGDGDAHRFSKSDTVGKYKLQFLPWGGVACQIPPSEAGRAFCFLPLPVKTRLPFFVNGYFELSSNRRDIWWGEDLVGEGRVRAQWNRVLLTDVIPHNHVRLVTVAQGKCDPAALGGYYQLFPREALEEPWGLVVTHFYRRIVSLPVLHTFAKRDSGGCWVSPKEAIFMDTDSPVDRAVLQATLVSLGMPITDPPAHVVAMLQQTADLMRCSPRLIRNLLRPTPSYSFVPDARHTAVQLLLYCLSDIAAGADEAVYRELLGLNLIPTCDGGFAAVAGAGDGPRLYVCQDAEVELLRPWYRQVLIDLEALPESIVEVLRSPAMQARTNVTTATPAIVARLVQGVTPTQWEGRRTVPPADWEAHPGGLYHREWLTKLWRYIERRGGDLKAFEGLPVLATEEQHLCFLRPLQVCLPGSGPHRTWGTDRTLCLFGPLGWPGGKALRWPRNRLVSAHQKLSSRLVRLARFIKDAQPLSPWRQVLASVARISISRLRPLSNLAHNARTRFEKMHFCSSLNKLYSTAAWSATFVIAVTAPSRFGNPPPIRRPNLADFAELVCRIVGFLNLADLFCRITRFLGLCRLVLLTCWGFWVLGHLSWRRHLLWQPPPTAYLLASGGDSEVPSLLMHPYYPPLFVPLPIPSPSPLPSSACPYPAPAPSVSLCPSHRPPRCPWCTRTGSPRV